MKKLSLMFMLVVLLLAVSVSDVFSQKGAGNKGPANKGNASENMSFQANARRDNFMVIENQWWKLEDAAALKLTSIQVNKLEDIFAEYKRESIQLRYEIDSKSFEIELLLQQPNYNIPKMEAMVDDMIESCKKMEKLRIMTRIKMLDVLDSTQRESLRTIFNSNVSRRRFNNLP